MRWDVRKNESLEVARGVTFEAVVVAIGAGSLLDIVAHPNTARYPGQRVLVIAIDGYVHLVPFVEEKDHLFLKTIIPSRKATRDYLGRRLARGADAARRPADEGDPAETKDGRDA
jgi:hypothetical protein